MWYLASLLAFCLCVSSQITEDVDEWVLLRGRMEDLDYTPDAFSELKAISRFGVVSSQNFQIFDADGINIGFSDNFDQITHNIESMLVSWDLDDEEFGDGRAQPRPTTNGLQETYSSIYYFTTPSDGEVWAYHAFIHADDTNDRYPDPITNRGDSLLYKWEGSNFEDTPSYRVYSIESTTKAYFFTTGDREFLWTASVAKPYTRTGTPNCTIHEYKGGNWGIATGLAYNCTKFPLQPLVFTNNVGQWLYLDVAWGTGTFNTAGALNGAVNQVAVGQKFYTYRNNGLYDAEVIDNLAFSNVIQVEHFVNDKWDYLVALTTDGLTTTRLHWTPHRAQDLQVVRTTRTGTHMHMFEFWEHTCLSISYGDYPGLTESTPTVWDTYFVIYCWDQAHDRWNLVQRVPSFGVIKTETFVDDDRLFLVALSNRGHLNQHTVTVYEMTEWYEDEFLITREPEFGAYEQSKMVSDIAEELDDIHHYKAMIIATLSLLATVFILQLLLLAKGMSGGGGGGGDYQSFS